MNEYGATRCYQVTEQNSNVLFDVTFYFYGGSIIQKIQKWTWYLIKDINFLMINISCFARLKVIFDPDIRSDC
jgi:hypothetical protein